jgi:hypothetical protein
VITDLDIRLAQADGRAVLAVEVQPGVPVIFPTAARVLGMKLGSRVPDIVVEFDQSVRDRGRKLADGIPEPPRNADEEWLIRNSVWLGWRDKLAKLASAAKKGKGA